VVWIGIILLDVLKGMFLLFLCLRSMIWGRVKAQAISRPPLTMDTPVQFHISLRGILVDKMSMDRVFPKYFGVRANCPKHIQSCNSEFSN